MALNTDWLRAAGWGVFFHYLAAPASSRDAPSMTVDAWNRRVDGFAVEDFAEQVAQTGAGYAIFTLGQNTGFYCSPNAAYDALTGIAPSKCSRRDLLAEVAGALARRGIKTLAYLPSHAPAQDRAACIALRCTPSWDASAWGFKETLPGAENTDERLAEFQRHWEAIIRAWSLRWGEAVSGWWIDGCYHADKMYRHDDAPNFASFAAALRAGNPQSIVAFNGGIKTPVRSLTEHEDYTAGELAGDLNVGGYFPGGFGPLRNPAGQAQLHVLTFAGGYWGRGEPRFPDELIVGYTRFINEQGGVVSWDVPLSDDGQIPPAFIAQLSRLARPLRVSI